MLDEAGLGHLLMSGSFTSDIAIARRLQTTSEVLTHINEASHIIASFKNKNASTMHAAIMTTLLDAFSQAGRVWRIKEYADTEKTITVKNPHFSATLSSTPDVWDQLDTGDVKLGLLPRCLLFSGQDTEPNLNYQKEPVPDFLLQLLRDANKVDQLGQAGDLPPMGPIRS